MMQAIDSIVTSEMKQQFEEDGYFVLPNIVSPIVLDNLRDCLDKEID